MVEVELSEVELGDVVVEVELLEVELDHVVVELQWLAHVQVELLFLVLFLD